MHSDCPKTEKTVFGLLIFFSLLDGAIRWGILPVGAILCNPGIALGIALPPEVLWLGIGSFLIVSLYQALSRTMLLERFAWTSIFFGGLVNCLDRLFHGCVQDYLNPLFFPSFNLADSMLFLGVAILFFAALKISLKMKPPYVS